jgi:hypothetical protein
MRHTFNPFTGTLTGLACCMALGLTASTCVEASGAVVSQNTPNSQAALAGWASSGLIVDSGIDCFVGQGPVMDNPSQEPMPAFLPDADLADKPWPAADEAAAGSNVASLTSDDMCEIEFKYSHYSNYHGSKLGVNSAAQPSTGGADDSDTASSTDDASTHDDGAGVTDDSATAEEKVADAATENSKADADGTEAMPSTGNEAKDGSDEGNDVAGETAGPSDKPFGDATFDDDCCRMTLAEAFAAMASNYADELAARYGLASSGLARLVGWK